MKIRFLIKHKSTKHGSVKILLSKHQVHQLILKNRLFLFGYGDAQSPPQSFRFKVIRQLNDWKKYEIGSFNASIDENGSLESDDDLNPDPSLRGIISEAYEIYKKTQALNYLSS